MVASPVSVKLLRAVVFLSRRLLSHHHIFSYISLLPVLVSFCGFTTSSFGPASRPGRRGLYASSKCDCGQRSNNSKRQHNDKSEPLHQTIILGPPAALTVMACCILTAVVINQLIKICDAFDIRFLPIKCNDDEGDACASASTNEKGTSGTCRITIAGMTCSACSSTITQQIEAVDGVHRASVSLALARGTVSYNASETTPAPLVSAVQKAGYEATLEGLDALGTVERLDQTQELHDLRQAISSASTFSTMIVGLEYMLALMQSKGVVPCPPQLLAWIALLLAFKVQVFDARSIHIQACVQKMTMDTLLSLSLLLGLGLALLQALLQQERNSKVYASSGSFLIIVILAGRYLEAVLKRESYRNLATLYELQTEKKMYWLVKSEVSWPLTFSKAHVDPVTGDCTSIIAEERRRYPDSTPSNHTLRLLHLRRQLCNK